MFITASMRHVYPIRIQNSCSTSISKTPSTFMNKAADIYFVDAQCIQVEKIRVHIFAIRYFRAPEELARNANFVLATLLCCERTALVSCRRDSGISAASAVEPFYTSHSVRVYCLASAVYRDLREYIFISSHECTATIRNIAIYYTVHVQFNRVDAVTFESLWFITARLQ